jgi:hypothetical protein
MKGGGAYERWQSPADVGRCTVLSYVERMTRIELA